MSVVGDITSVSGDTGTYVSSSATFSRGAVLDVGLEKALKATAGVGTSVAGDPEILYIWL